MSERTSETLQDAAWGTERLMGLYSTITASDPQLYATALVQVFSNYPRHLIETAVDPLKGLPGVFDFPPSVAAVKKFMDGLLETEKSKVYLATKRDRELRERLAEPPEDPEMSKRVSAGLRELAEQIGRGIGPSSV